MRDHGADVEFIQAITPAVLGVLKKEHFFERLDDLFSPVDPAHPPIRCGHSFDHSLSILRSLEMDPDDLEDVLAVLQSKGACCDCEILYNVAQASRLKAEYWKERASESVDKGKQAQTAKN
jgi:hypothetical protein